MIFKYSGYLLVQELVSWRDRHYDTVPCSTEISLWDRLSFEKLASESLFWTPPLKHRALVQLYDHQNIFELSEDAKLGAKIDPTF